MYRVVYKFLVSLWLLVAMNCGSTGGGSTKPHLPQEEVNAVQVLVQRLKTQPWELDRNFSAYDCGVQLKTEIKCNCNLENHTICRVTEIDFSSHDLRGRIPAEIGNLTHLTSLDLSENKLQGSIPKSFGNLSQLLELDLSNNYLEGPMPPFLSELKSLQFIYLSDNWFNGSIPSALGALPSLTFLRLDNNVLSGPIPYELGNASSLENLILYNNRLSGQLPHQLGNLKNMQIMSLDDNEFIGQLPPSFKELKNLRTFFMFGNNFKGPIPEYIATWEHLRVLVLMGNNFEGPLPTDIATWEHLQVLAVNGLTASPRGVKNFTFPNVTMMTSLKRLTLRNCSLTGPIPDFIWQLPLLSYLDLSFNNLTGVIPNVVHQHFWKAIFLKGNNLTGSLPGWLTSLSDSYVDVSENFFTNAAITPGNISKNLNLFLCCSNMTTMPAKWQESQEVYHNCNKTLIPRNRASSRLSVVQIAGIVGSFLLFFILILGVLWKSGFFGGKKLHDEELKRIELFPGGVFNFRQIKAATQNFSNANKLGEGGFGTVYKGALPNGTFIAVKQLSARSKQGVREFVNEIGSEEFKLRLNWPTRVKICLGIAKGLAFLHEESKLKIVHRDIKPTNILLDKDFNAKISDFGFAKLYEEEKTHVITRVAGTTGYMAPEYAMRGYLTDKADVYSFGVVTLEIISGKNSAIYRPNDQTVYLLDLAYVLQEQGNLIELVDPALSSDYSWKEATTILDLAMMCTNPSPTLRPTMSEVVKIIEGKSKIISSKISAPYPKNEFTTANAIAALSQSRSTSQERASNITLSHSVSKEIEESTSSADYAAEIINGQRGISATETS